MGNIKQPAAVKLICSILTRPHYLFEEAVSTLIDRYGPIDFRSEPLPFAHTSYYRDELGPDLERVIIAFEQLADPGCLADVKNATNALEDRWRIVGKRQINLDPGYLSLAKLVLATTKDHGHRVYLRDGIYAEVTLRYRDGAFRPWEWTYPDYVDLVSLFEEIRKLYRQQQRATVKESGE